MFEEKMINFFRKRILFQLKHPRNPTINFLFIFILHHMLQRFAVHFYHF